MTVIAGPEAALGDGIVHSLPLRRAEIIDLDVSCSCVLRLQEKPVKHFSIWHGCSVFLFV